mmetsp:Transcript_7939/g.12424  ORF Transcript_7939/g.12424 Transcript_7939/m.12424 type:complete len:92 (+) Transcript_7939:67-342(+)
MSNQQQSRQSRWGAPLLPTISSSSVSSASVAPPSSSLPDATTNHQKMPEFPKNYRATTATAQRSSQGQRRGYDMSSNIDYHGGTMTSIYIM